MLVCGTGRTNHTYTCFSSQSFDRNRRPEEQLSLHLRSRYVGRIHTMNPLRLLLREQCINLYGFRNINLMSIAYALRLGLGPTNPEMITMAQETLLLRPGGFSPPLWLLSPAFSLPNAPQNFTILLHRR